MHVLRHHRSFITEQITNVLSQKQSYRGIKKEVIIKLIADVEGLGKRDDILSVAAGRMRNALHPYRLAIYAPPGSVPKVKEKKIEIKKVDPGVEAEKLARAQVRRVLRELTWRSLKFRLPVTEEKKLNRPLTLEYLIHYIRKNKQIELSPLLLEFPGPISELGEHSIKMKVTSKEKKEYVMKLKIMEKENKD